MFLGMKLIGGKRIDMAKSKIVKVNEKIAETVAGGYQEMKRVSLTVTKNRARCCWWLYKNRR